MSEENAILKIGMQLLFNMLNGQEEAATESDDSGKDAALMNLKRKDGCVVLILGARESGKTVLALRLAEFFGRPTYMIAPNGKVPGWAKPIQMNDVEHIPSHSTIILDDLPVYMSSRDYNESESRVVEKIIPICRHKGLDLIFCTQTSGYADRWVMDADAIFFKKPSLLFADLERPAVKKLSEKAHTAFVGHDDNWLHKHAYMVTHEWEGVVSVSKPGNDAEVPIDGEFVESGA